MNTPCKIPYITLVYVFTSCMHAQLLSHVQLFATLWTAAHQAPLSMGFSRQEYWSGLQFSPPGYLPNSEIEPTPLASPALTDKFFTTEPRGKPLYFLLCTKRKNVLKGKNHLLIITFTLCMTYNMTQSVSNDCLNVSVKRQLSDVFQLDWSTLTVHVLSVRKFMLPYEELCSYLSVLVL